MNYLDWKKRVRRAFKEIKRKQMIKGVTLVLPKKRKRGATIHLGTKTIFIPYNHMLDEYQKLHHQYTLEDVSCSVLCHELGHYLQLERNSKRELIQHKFRTRLYLNGIVYKNGYSVNEKLDYLRFYRKLTLRFEEEAWNLGFDFYKGCANCYDELRILSVRSYSDGVDSNIQLIEKQRYQK